MDFNTFFSTEFGQQLYEKLCKAYVPEQLVSSFQERDDVRQAAILYMIDNWQKCYAWIERVRGFAASDRHAINIIVKYTIPRGRRSASRFVDDEKFHTENNQKFIRSRRDRGAGWDWIDTRIDIELAKQWGITEVMETLPPHWQRPDIPGKLEVIVEAHMHYKEPGFKNSSGEMKWFCEENGVRRTAIQNWRKRLFPAMAKRLEDYQ